jgi:uncharacterized membrane protein
MEAEERRIAALLWGGTWAVSALLAAGLAIPGAWGPLLMKAGVAMFILLPVSRVLLMLVQFLRRRDKVHAAIALLVLAVVGAGMVLGL